MQEPSMSALKTAPPRCLAAVVATALAIGVVAGLAPLPAVAGPLAENYGAATVKGKTSSGLYDAQDLYTLDVVPWEANLLPLKPIYARSMAASFFSVLSVAFPSDGERSFSNAAAELSEGSLVIRSYDALGTDTLVGAELQVEYRPAIADPSTDIHWIQVVRNNHKADAAHGTEDWKVDNLGSDIPFYDVVASATSTNFFDQPTRNDPGESHIWIGQLLLVQGAADGAGAITFLGGLTWGWENHPLRAAVATFSTDLGIDLTAPGVPEPQAWGMLLVGLAALARRAVVAGRV